MGFSVKVEGSWRDAGKLFVKVAGSWREAEELFVKAGGVWKSAWKNEIWFINNDNRTEASIHALMGSPSQPGNYFFENRATISGGDTAFALRTGVFPAGSTLTIINKGYIRGRGGRGGDYNQPGQPGGHALYLDFPCTLDNGAGYIFGGGGGGGGAYQQDPTTPNRHSRAAGGGGAGSPPKAGGGGTGGGGENTAGIAPPSPGSYVAGGAGGRVYAKNGSTASLGGTGGGAASPGTAGGNPSPLQLKNERATYPGGAGGLSIAKNGNTLVITAGNTSDRIKGAQQ